MWYTKRNADGLVIWDGFAMQNFNPYRFYETAAKLHGLFNCSTQSRVRDMFAPLTEAQTALDALIKGDPLPIETSKPDALKLLSRISALFDRYYIDPSTKQLRNPTGEDRIDQHELSAVFALLEKFEHSLAAELCHAPTYAAGKRGIYSTHDLAENAHGTFPESLREVIPSEAQREFDVAGRALVFGLGTAAAMHLLRAVEIVLKQYYEAFAGVVVAKTERNYGIYLKKLAALAEDDTARRRPDKRLLQMLAQIKEHYRNPLTAPESGVSTEQATSLFGLAGAIITLMSEQMIDMRQNGGKKMSALLEPETEDGDDAPDAKPVRAAG